MTDTIHETNTRKMNELLQARGAIGARLISVIQVAGSEYTLNLQTDDDRRIEVHFKSKAILNTQLEVKVPAAEKEGDCVG